MASYLEDAVKDAGFNDQDVPAKSPFLYRVLDAVDQHSVSIESVGGQD